MDPKSFGESEVYESFDRFSDFMNELMHFSTIIGADIVMTVERPQKVQARHHAILEALVLTASWGALESFVEDVCKALLRERRGEVNPQKLKPFKFSAEDLFSPSEERINIIFKAITNAVVKGVGVGKFENLLSYVDLDGEVPTLVKTGLFETQQIRNIWAHKAGRADKRFVDAAPQLGYLEGENVDHQRGLVSLPHQLAHLLSNRVFSIHGEQWMEADRTALRRGRPIRRCVLGALSPHREF